MDTGPSKDVVRDNWISRIEEVIGTLNKQLDEMKTVREDITTVLKTMPKFGEKMLPPDTLSVPTLPTKRCMGCCRLLDPSQFNNSLKCNECKQGVYGYRVYM